MKTPQEIINSKLKSRERVTLRFHISIGSIAQGVGDTTERETVRERERERGGTEGLLYTVLVIQNKRGRVRCSIKNATPSLHPIRAGAIEAAHGF